MTNVQAPTRDLLPSEDELDPELLALPDPPKRERTLTIAMLLCTAMASVLMIVALRRDAAYAFAPADAVDVGDFATAPADSLHENEYVHGAVMLGAAHAIRYERPLVSESFRLMPVSGRHDVWVEVRVPPGAETIRWVPPREVSGRLLRFESAGPKHRGLASAVHDATGQTVAPDAWLLVQGDPPSGSRWAVLLELLFAGFAIWNLVVSAKLLRRVT